MARKQTEAFIQVQEYYLSSKPKKLSPNIEAMRIRMMECHKLLSNFETKTDIAFKLSKAWNVSERTIYSDMLATEKLFGNILKMDKEYLRAALQHAYMKAFKEASEEKDYKNMEIFGYRLEKVSKLHHFDVEEIDMSKRVLQQVVIGSDLATLEAQRAENLSDHAEDAEIVE